MPDWRDSSSYSQGSRGTREPTAWTCGAFPYEVTVHRLHGVPDAWFASASGLGIEVRDLGTEDLEEAMRRALELVREEAGAWLRLASEGGEG